MKDEKFKVLLYLKKSSPDKSGKTPIMGRITVGQSMAQFSCKLSCTPSLWNPRESRLNGKSREAVATNAKLDRLLLSVNEAYAALVERKQPFTAEDVKNLFQGSAETQMTLLKLFDRLTDELKARIGIDRATGTLPTYTYTRRALTEFIRKKFNASDLAFGQLNEQFIREFQEFVLLDKGLAMDTLRHYLALLKKVCKIAYKEGHSEKCHFAHYKLPKQKETTPKALSREDFEKIRDLEISENRISHVITRDLFLFACYTGTSYADTVSITRENIFTDEEGNLWLKYRRKKNELLGRVKLLLEAIDLIKKYKDEFRKTLFPKQLYATLRSNMKGLRIMANLSQDLVYHAERHSFASLVTLEEGVPIETISRMLGHSNITTTQIYARVTPKKLFEDMDRFIETTKDLVFNPLKTTAMRSTFKILFYINRNKIKADDTTAVLCRITVDGKQTVLTTGIYCRPDEFDSKKGEVRDNKANNRLSNFLTRIEQTYEAILKDTGVVSAELLKNTIVGVNLVPTMLLQAGEAERERLRVRSLEIKSTSTFHGSKTTQRNLRDFLLSRGKEDIAFTEITEEFGESFKLFLKRDMGYNPGHINHCLCWLNRLIYIAVDQEILKSNPIEDVAYEKKNPPKLKYIAKSELKRIMETPMHSRMLELVHRAFIFSSFRGLAYVDMQRLYPRHIGKTAEGRLYIRKKRVKTNVEAFIPLHPVAEQILKLYNTEDDSTPVFPLPENRNVIWNDINQIGIVAGLKENLSYHKSRHSFGTLLLSAGISIESIAKMMGHANISTTEGYAKVTDDKISEDMDRLIERRNKRQGESAV